MKLLIVDDHDLNLKLLRAQLEGEGHQVVAAADGVEALEILGREPVDGVISDILMPRMDGYRLCMEVRSDARLVHLPFVLYTSTYNSPGDRELAESLGADAYVHKPAPTSRLIGAVVSAANSRQAGAPPPAPAVHEPQPLMKPYNEVLIRKLEEKGLELERTHEGLAESQARLSGLVDSAMDAIIAVDERRRIVLFNPAAGRMFGCDPGQALGRSLNDFIPTRSRDLHDRHMLAFAREGGAARPMGQREVAALRADGTEFPIEANISRIETSQGQLFTAFIRDVTERRHAELALQASEAGLRRAQDVARMAHAIIDENRHIESRSESLADLLGLPPEALPSHVDQWLALVHPDDRARVNAVSAEARSLRRRLDFTYRVRRGSDWRYIRHILELLPQRSVDEGGLRTFNTLQDVTEQRVSEDKIRRLNRVYAVLSAINSLIVRAGDRDELFRQACRILVETGRFSKAWIGLVDEGIHPIRIMAWDGGDEAYFQDLQDRLTDAQSGAGGLIKRALGGHQPVVSNDVGNDPRVALRAKLVASGSFAFALFPLVAEGKTVGALSIHSPTVGFFDGEETQLLQGLADDISFALDRLIKADRIRYLAHHDPLTGLPNRALFSELLAQQLPERERGENLVCVALLDLVRFRRINETLGRRAGDELLMQVATRLREIDPCAGRLGPDLFALQLADRRTPTELVRDFEQLAGRCFDAPFHIGGEEIRMGCRIGAAVHPGDGDDPEALLRNAESALRRARAAVEPHVFYAPDMNDSANEAMALESRLRGAIEREEFVLHYQPKLRLSDRRICGIEALIRWQDPERGLVPPMRFIPVLEDTGLISIVGKWALRRALADLRDWRAAGAAPVRVAVNVSPLQLNQPEFAARIAGLFATPAEAAMLELEITESVIMHDVDRKIGMLREIRDLGVNIAVDDFGTGYSSLSYIARLPITSLKIDRAFVTDMTSGPVGHVLVSSIIALAHALKLKVVAEGVETEEQARMLLNLDCDEGQGYLFSKPVPAAAMLALLLAEPAGGAE